MSVIEHTIGTAVQLALVKGDTFTFGVTWKVGATVVDLTGYSAQLLDSDYVAIPASVSIPVPANGRVVVSFTAAQTLVMSDQYYRVRVVSGVFQRTLLQGRIDVRGPSV